MRLINFLTYLLMIMIIFGLENILDSDKDGYLDSNEIKMDTDRFDGLNKILDKD